jgi:hypothetical protein
LAAYRREETDASRHRDGDLSSVNERIVLAGVEAGAQYTSSDATSDQCVQQEDAQL